MMTPGDQYKREAGRAAEMREQAQNLLDATYAVYNRMVAEATEIEHEASKEYFRRMQEETQS